MIRIAFIALLIIGIAPASLFGQKKSKSKKMRYSKISDPHQDLEKLRTIAPEEAIPAIEKLIVTGTKNEDNLLLGKCYELLGDIYEKFGQDELAKNRFRDALSYLSLLKEKELLANVYRKIGNIYLNQKIGLEVKANFQLCLDYTNEDQLIRLCQEGFADGLRLLTENKEAILNYEKLLQSYDANQDSSSLVRINAKLAKVYAFQENNTEEALYNFNQSQTYSNVKTNRKDYKELEETKEILIQQQPELEIDYRNQQNVLNRQNLNSDELIDENIKLADAYMAKEDYKSAQTVIEESKKIIAFNTVPPKKQSEIFKRSASLTEKRGEFEAAIYDLKKAEEQQALSINERQKEIDQLIAILEGQRKIDLTKKNLKISASESALYDSKLNNQRILIGLLSFLLIGAIIAFYKIWKSNKEKQAANHLLQLKSLRAQMNPHFIFNVLNSVNQYISLNDEKNANKYLSDVSKLMRIVLEDSQKDLIHLEDELDMIHLYMKLEHGRFKDKFEYKIEIDESVKSSSIAIPPMLIQPFLENAIWHGIRYRKDKGFINLNAKENDNSIRIEITDNGIGRKKSLDLKTNKQKDYDSVGLKNVSKRIELINLVYNKSYEISVSDNSDDSEYPGTKILIQIPKQL